MGLLGEIEAAALDSAVPLPDLLRKCKVLAARLRHGEFAAWVGHELNGYPDKGSLPPYRLLRLKSSLGFLVGPMGSKAQNVPIPTGGLPEDLQKLVTDLAVKESVGSLVTLIRDQGENLRVDWPADLVALVANRYPIYEHMTLVSAWRPIGSGTISGILDTIRTRILDFVLAIREENPNAGDDAPGKSGPIPATTVTQVFHTTIVGGQAIVGNSGDASIGSGNVASGKTAGRDITEPKQLLPLLEELRKEAEKAPEDARTEALELVDKIKKGAEGPKEKFSADKMLKYLSVYTTLVTAVSDTVPPLEHALKWLASATGL